MRIFKYIIEIKKEKIVAVSMAVLILYGGIFGMSRFMRNDSEEINRVPETEVTESVSTDVPYEEVPFHVNAKSAILMDADTGKVLYAYKENEKLPPASVTKIMTMLLTFEALESGKISLGDTVRISSNAAGMGGSQMYMEEGEEHTVEELLKGIAMVSANDGCVAIAEFLSGTDTIFVESMNKKAKELGMKNTSFKNTNGLPDNNHYSSAYDIAIMSRELLKYTGSYPWFTTWQDTVTIGLPGKEKEFGLTNTNKLIKEYQGAIGIKTGFTSDAGYCLSGAAKRDDTVMIAVVMGCESSKIRLNEITKLLDYGFANYETVVIAEESEIMGEISSIKGMPEKADVISEDKISILVPKGEKDGIMSEILIYDDYKIPLQKGEKVGEIVIKINGIEAERHDLVSSEDMKRAGFLKISGRLFDKIKNRE